LIRQNQEEQLNQKKHEQFNYCLRAIGMSLRLSLQDLFIQEVLLKYEIIQKGQRHKEEYPYSYRTNIPVSQTYSNVFDS
jgi:hypothetical protein